MKPLTPNLKKLILGIIPILLFLIFWEIGAGIIPEGVISPASDAIAAVFESAASGLLWTQTLISLERVILGFLLSLLLGVPLGFLLGTFFKSTEKVLLPFMRACEKLNPFAIIPIFMIFFGIGTAEKVVVIFWSTLWPVLFNTMAGARNIDQNLLRMVRSMGATRWELLRKVIFPYTLPNIFIGIEFAAQVAFFMIIASEVIGASTGLGWYYTSSATKYDLPLMYGIVLYITVLGIGVNVIFARLKKHFLVWKQASELN
ncbi:binding-protein-dependent transport systems inner membrane component [Syntrophobotulus glycolicus DSM 8271]|uniref:Binding-protein-dependent transport systems inner membrane component n=1 Tax=Syntrophobotulus glycolicus (strain DSM 8271 / FlGlyR) TaxID=645991 RepID=F0SYI2_SYNGF|nr:ABC transporter permease [Syntrophobotulus glycolicus]ADY57094.1 binding-protein-dependent transport systems inner membrane component [Syntrophobotulus glycolicus DSM 8271]